MTDKEMDKYMEEFWQDDSSEYDNLVELALDKLVELLDSDTPSYAVDNKLRKYVRGELEDYDVPSFFANRIVEHAKQKYLDL